MTVFIPACRGEKPPFFIALHRPAADPQFGAQFAQCILHFHVLSTVKLHAACSQGFSQNHIPQQGLQISREGMKKGRTPFGERPLLLLSKFELLALPRGERLRRRFSIAAGRRSFPAAFIEVNPLDRVLFTHHIPYVLYVVLQ